jgi:hypothetical protein
VAIADAIAQAEEPPRSKMASRAAHATGRRFPVHVALDHNRIGRAGVRRVLQATAANMHQARAVQSDVCCSWLTGAGIGVVFCYSLCVVCCAVLRAQVSLSGNGGASELTADEQRDGRASERLFRLKYDACFLLSLLCLSFLFMAKAFCGLVLAALLLRSRKALFLTVWPQCAV